MVDLPVAIIEALPSVDWAQVSEKIEDYGPVIKVVQHTWSHESLADILQGRLTVPDEVINDALKERCAQQGSGNLKSVTISSQENGQLMILADTEKLGRVEFYGTIEELVHNKDTSHIVYKIKSRALKDHGLASWFFSRISLSMVQRMFGRLELSEDLPMTIKGNTITVDYKPALESSELASTQIHGTRLLELFDIESATPHKGYIVFKTKVNIPESIREMLLNILK